MYHIKSDTRSQKSAEKIYDALCQLLNVKHFSDISISDIQKISSISRATFYRHFDNLADVLAWKCDIYFAQMFQSYLDSDSKSAQRYDFMQYLLNYWSKNSEILEILLAINRTDIIYDSHLKSFQNYIKQITPTFTDNSHYEYAMGLRCGLMIGILMVWIRNRKKQSAEELFEIIRDDMELLQKSELII